MNALDEGGAEIHVGDRRSVSKCTVVVANDGELGQCSGGRDPSVVLPHARSRGPRTLLHQTSAVAVLVMDADESGQPQQPAFDCHRIACTLDQLGEGNDRDVQSSPAGECGSESPRRANRSVGYLVEVVDQERRIEEVISQGQCAAGGCPNSALPTPRRHRPSELHACGSTPAARRLATSHGGGPWRRTSSSPARPDGR